MRRNLGGKEKEENEEEEKEKGRGNIRPEFSAWKTRRRGRRVSFSAEKSSQN